MKLLIITGMANIRIALTRFPLRIRFLLSALKGFDINRPSLSKLFVNVFVKVLTKYL